MDSIYTDANVGRVMEGPLIDARHPARCHRANGKAQIGGGVLRPAAAEPGRRSAVTAMAPRRWPCFEDPELRGYCSNCARRWKTSPTLTRLHLHLSHPGAPIHGPSARDIWCAKAAPGRPGRLDECAERCRATAHCNAPRDQMLALRQRRMVQRHADPVLSRRLTGVSAGAAARRAAGALE